MRLIKFVIIEICTHKQVVFLYHLIVLKYKNCNRNLTCKGLSFQRLFQLFKMEPAAHEDDLFDRWVRQYSEAVKTNLCPYFEWFNLKITDETKEFCKTLPGNYQIAIFN